MIIIILQKGGSFPVSRFNPQIMNQPTALGWYEGSLSATWGCSWRSHQQALWNESSCHQHKERRARSENTRASPLTPVLLGPAPGSPTIGQRAAKNQSYSLWRERGSRPMAKAHGRPVNWLIECSQIAGCPVSQIIHQRVGASAGLSSCEHMRWTNAVSSTDLLESLGSGKTGRPESVTKDNIRQIVLKSLKQEERTWGRSERGPSQGRCTDLDLGPLEWKLPEWALQLRRRVASWLMVLNTLYILLRRTFRDFQGTVNILIKHLLWFLLQYILGKKWVMIKVFHAQSGWVFQAFIDPSVHFLSNSEDPSLKGGPAGPCSVTTVATSQNDQGDSHQSHWLPLSGSGVTLLKLVDNMVEFVVQSLSCVLLFATPWTTARQASLSFTVSWNLLKLMSIESVIPSNHLILCCPLLLPPSIFPSIRVFSSKKMSRSSHQGAKVLELQLNCQYFQRIFRVDLL